MASGNAELDAKIKEWLEWDKNEKSLNEVKQLVDQKKFDTLSQMLLNRLTFGTAGIRGKMETGYSGMNDLVIIQTGQGLIKYLEETDQKTLKQNGIVVGYDGRHNSKRWAELTAAIFLTGNYPVRLFSDVNPTPFIPFAVKEWKCVAGIMITASHNPKEDNGYKVYGSNGSQIISPVDHKIQDAIMANLVPLETSWKTEIIQQSKHRVDPLTDCFNRYVNCISSQIIAEHKATNKNSTFKFTYTAMHGVGYRYIQRLFDEIGVQIIPVKEQIQPDPEFPTVKFPNPEEGKSALDLSFKTADANNSTVIIANDPDADRLAAAEKDPKTGQWKVFTGNELGALLGWWCFHCYQTKYPSEPLNNVYMLASTVSSKILKSMAEAEGFNFVETLTGFKWMGNRAYELMKQNKQVLFAFEEAIGFMYGTTVLDKDGISAGAHLATMTLYLNHHGLTLIQQLQEIYQVYGFHICLNSYFICHDQEKIKRIFERLRNFKKPNTYPTGIIDGQYKIIGIRDLTTGYDNTQPMNKAILPVSTSTQMITFNFDNGLVATLRTSGTEPKVKYYTELVTPPTQTDRQEVEHTLKEMVDGIVFEFLQPQENGLIPKAD